MKEKLLETAKSESTI